MVAFPAPFPAPTPPPTNQPSRPKRKRQSPSRAGASSKSSISSRQVITDADAVGKAQQDCQFSSGNDVISCFPTSDTTFLQHEWATFVWNSRRPEITQFNLVDIYLFHADSLKQVLHFPNQVNPPDQAGVIRAQVNDTWWGDRGNNFQGSSISYPFYWVITRSDKPLDGSELPQATFRAVQTAVPDSVAAAMASSAAAASSSASASSASASRARTSQTGTPGGVQSASKGSSFPHWAIAVIVILGFFALVATCVLVFLIMRRLRRNSSVHSSNRNSIGSASPMIEHNLGNSPGSPLLATAAIHAPHRHPSSVGHHAPSVTSPDGASTLSRANSAVGEGGPFSGADAAIMADAFRKALRKPDFAGRPLEEGDSPANSDERKEQLLSQELAEEGRDIRSVGSSRGVTVETQSDAGDTVHDHQQPRHSSPSPFFHASS